MAKFNAEVAVAFATQSAEGTYNATLDAITTTLTAADGLLLGDPESGVNSSGLSFGAQRGKRDKGFVSGSFTRPLSDFLKAEVPTFTFAVPFCGNRADTTATPVDGDFPALTGIDALLEGAGMVGTNWASGVGYSYKFGSAALPISALVYINGNRLELLDCRCSLSIAYEAGNIPILTATIEVGSIKNHAEASLPSTLTFGEQATVSAPTITAVANQWQDSRGFQTATLSIAPAIEAISDSNQLTGEVKEQTDRTVSLSATLFADDTTNRIYEYSQLTETSAANLDPLSFTVGAAAVGSDPALAHTISIPTPELDTWTPDAFGTKAGADVNLIARNTVANEELEIIFI